MTVTGERRLEFIAPKGSNLRMCAESLPEVSSAVAAATGASANIVDKGAASVNDAFKTALLQTFTRTEIAEVLRQMGWQACQAWAQGALDDAQYREQLAKIIDAGIKVVELRASQPLSAAPVNQTIDPSAPKIEEKDAMKEEEAASTAD